MAKEDISDNVDRGLESRKPNETLTAYVTRRVGAGIPKEHAVSFGSARNYLGKILGFIPLERVTPSVDALGEPVIAALHFASEDGSGFIYVYSTGTVIVVA